MLLHKKAPDLYTMAAYYGNEQLPKDIYLDQFKLTKSLLRKIRPPKLITKSRTFLGVRLCHPGLTRTEATVRQHFNWKNLRHSTEQVCKKGHACQLTKKLDPKIEHLPTKEAEVNPWDMLCVDLIRPYTIHRQGTYKNGKKKIYITLWCVTMIDPATGWFNIAEIKTKRADIVSNVVETAWLTRYPYPTQVGAKKKPITARSPQATVLMKGCIKQ
eukprot:14097478-Ditylum_brightwellii.AAC.1